MSIPASSQSTSRRSMFDAGRMDLSSLVGHEILLVSDRFDQQLVRSRIVLVHDRTLSLDRGNADMEQLADNDPLLVQFDYKGQRVSLNASFTRSDTGKCTVVLGDQAVPLSVRRFHRFTMSLPIRCAVVPIRSFNAEKISRLRWVETESLNFSSGGVQLILPYHLHSGTYLLLCVEAEELAFPTLVLGWVRFAYPDANLRYRTGIEFITDNMRGDHAGVAGLQRLPASAFQYRAQDRNRIDRFLREKEQSQTGVEI